MRIYCLVGHLSSRYGPLMEGSLLTFMRLCHVLCRFMSLARDSANDGFVVSCLYMSWSLSRLLLFSIVHMAVSYGLCSVMCVCLVLSVVLARIVVLGVCLGPG